jgi:hypothetical protein
MTGRRLTLALLGLTLLVLAISVPQSLRDALDRGQLYVFSREFLSDIPKRLVGPGRFRFLLQPLIATVLGSRAGRVDARTAQPPYLWGLLFEPGLRRELLRSGLQSVANLVLMGILLDSVFQWLILGASYPGAAIVVGPTLIATPYAIARALANRLSPRSSSRRHTR